MKRIRQKLLIGLLTLATCFCGGAILSSVMPSITETAISANAATTYTTEHADVYNHEGLADSGMYFRAQSNGAPSNSDWSLRYTPTTADAVQFIRDGVTTNVGNTGAETIVKCNDNDYFIEGWAVGKNSNGWQVGDVYVLNGDFYNAANDATITFVDVKLRISAVSDAGQPTTIKYTPAINAGKMTSHASGGQYFTLAENDAPYNTNWSLRYIPTTADAIKRIRDGVTTNVGNTGAETIVKYGATDYFVESWAVGGLEDGDVFIFEGTFYNAANDIAVYIEYTEVTHWNNKWYFDIIQAGNAYAHKDGGDTAGVNFAMAANDAPYSSTWLETTYSPVTTSCILLTRSDTTTEVGYEARQTLYKSAERKYYFRLDAWGVGSVYQAGDVYTLKGVFKQDGGDVYLHISETVITCTATSTFTFDTGSYYEAGQLSANANNGSSTGFYFNTSANNAAYNSDWSVEYKPVSADNVKLLRGTETIAIGNVKAGTIVKTSTTDYYFKHDSFAAGAYSPFQDGDGIIISGEFYNEANKCTIHFEETYVFYMNGTFVYGRHANIAQGDVYAHEGLSTNCMYFRSVANIAPYNTDWSLRYTPTTADAVQFIRGGVTTNVGNTGAETIVKINATDYFIESWAVGVNTNGWQVGDIYVLNGIFENAANSASITFDNVKFVITAVTDGAPTIKLYYPTEINGGTMMGSTTNASTVNGVYFTLAENDAPYDTSWADNGLYNCSSTDCIKLTRGGVTYSVGLDARQTIVKYSPTEYYLKFEAWHIGSYAPLQDGDIITVGGKFTHNDSSKDVTLTLEETVIRYDRGVYIFENDTYCVGEVGEHANGGYYFSMAENNAYFETDNWGIRYTPTSADAITLTRGGTTTNVANTGAETIVKYGATNYYLEVANIGGALEEGDMVTFNGYFIRRAQRSIIKVENTKLIYTDGKFVVMRDGFSMIDGAAVRLNDEKMGIRFTAQIGAEYDASAEYGMLIVPKSYLTMLSITGDYYTQLREKLGDSAYIAAMGAIPFQATTTGNGMVAGWWYVRGAITTLQYNNMNTEFFGIAYMLKDGVYTYAKFTEGKNERSLVEVSSLALRDQSNYDTDQIAILNGFVERGMNQSQGNADSNEYEYTLSLSNSTINYMQGYPINVKLSLGLPAGADVAVTWTSSNPDVIAVDQDGNVIGLKTGSATITAVCMGQTFTCEVTNQAGAKPKDLQKKGNILSWMALAELNEYIARVYDSNNALVATVIVDGTAYDLSSLGLTEGSKYTVSVCGVINGKETSVSKLQITYDDYSDAYATSNESSERTSIGVWTGSYHFDDPYWIKELANAGYDLIIGMNPVWHESIDAFIADLDKAYEYGVNIIVDPRNYVSYEDADGKLCHTYEPWNGEINTQQYKLDIEIGTPSQYLTHPAIVSVMGWDEPWESISHEYLDADAYSPTMLRGYEEVFTTNKASINRNDLTYFINLLPSHAVGGATDSSDCDYLDTYVNKYLNTESGLQTYEQISVDDYPILTDGSSDYIRKSYYYGFEQLATKARDEGKDLYYTLLSSAHGAFGDGASHYYELPTAETLRWQMAVGMAFGASNLTHYTYTSDAEDYTTMVVPTYDANGNLNGWVKHDLFDVIKGVNDEYLAWDEIYRNYSWQGYAALDFGSTSDNNGFIGIGASYNANAMMKVLENNVAVNTYGGLSSIAMSDGSSSTSTANNAKDLLVGMFKDEGGNMAFMLTNAGSAVNSYSIRNYLYTNIEGYSMVDIGATLTFDAGYVGAWVINKGVKTYHTLTDNTLTLTVGAYDGAFVIPVKAKANLGTLTVNAFDSAEKSISWNAVENAYAYNVTITRDGNTVVDTVVFDTTYVFDEVVFGDYVVTVTARNDGQYISSSGSKEFTLGLK